MPSTDILTTGSKNEINLGMSQAQAYQVISILLSGEKGQKLGLDKTIKSLELFTETVL